MRKFWLNWDNVKKLGHVLYQKIVSDYPKETSDTYQLLVPKVLRKEVLRNCHDSVCAGHLGVNKTVEKLRKKFYWYRYKEDVRLHIAIQSCQSTESATTAISSRVPSRSNRNRHHGTSENDSKRE